MSISRFRTKALCQYLWILRASFRFDIRSWQSALWRTNISRPEKWNDEQVIRLYLQGDEDAWIILSRCLIFGVRIDYWMGSLHLTYFDSLNTSRKRILIIRRKHDKNKIISLDKDRGKILKYFCRYLRLIKDCQIVWKFETNHIENVNLEKIRYYRLLLTLASGVFTRVRSLHYRPNSTPICVARARQSIPLCVQMSASPRPADAEKKKKVPMKLALSQG